MLSKTEKVYFTPLNKKIKKFQKGNNLENSKLTYKIVESHFNFLLEYQKINQRKLKLDFFLLTTKNSEHLELNKKLS